MGPLLDPQSRSGFASETSTQNLEVFPRAAPENTAVRRRGMAYCFDATLKTGQK